MRRRSKWEIRVGYADEECDNDKKEDLQYQVAKLEQRELRRLALLYPTPIDMISVLNRIVDLIEQVLVCLSAVPFAVFQ